MSARRSQEFEEIAMVKRKEPRIRYKPGPVAMAKGLETEALEQWLRIVDKPLAPEKRDGTNDASQRAQSPVRRLALRD